MVHMPKAVIQVCRISFGLQTHPSQGRQRSLSFAAALPRADQAIAVPQGHFLCVALLPRAWRTHSCIRCVAVRLVAFLRTRHGGASDELSCSPFRPVAALESFQAAGGSLTRPNGSYKHAAHAEGHNLGYSTSARPMRAARTSTLGHAPPSIALPLHLSPCASLSRAWPSHLAVADMILPRPCVAVQLRCCFGVVSQPEERAAPIGIAAVCVPVHRINCVHECVCGRLTRSRSRYKHRARTGGRGIAPSGRMALTPPTLV